MPGLRTTDAIARHRGPQPRCRWNGSSKTAANSRAKDTVTGTSTAVSRRNVGAPGGTRPSTSPYETAMTIGAWVRYRL